jgi:hypothetical protein
MDAARHRSAERPSGAGPTGLLFVTIFDGILGLSVLFPLLGPLGRALELSEM